MRWRLFALAMLLVGGCTMGPDYERPEVPDPAAYRDSFPEGESVANTPWWELFQDTMLTELIDSALVNNRDLRASMASISEARAILGIVRSDLFPRVNYFGAANSSANTDDQEFVNDGTLGVEISWQVDLWGRIRRGVEAAEQELLATEEAYRGVTITLVATVASTYMLLLDMDNRLDISRKTLKAWRENQEVVEARFRAGMVSEVDVSQASIQVFDAEISVQLYERLRAQTENALSVLLGIPPTTIVRRDSLTPKIMPPGLPVGLPSELLQRRPDILEAERRLHAQTARIGVAEAARFPQFDLNADVGALFAADTRGFVDLAATMFGPIFNSGQFQRQIDAEKARTEQLLNVYEQRILTALREVDDALVAVRTYHEEYESRKRQVAAAQKAAELSWVRYDGGMTSYLEVLDVQRSLFSSELRASETLQLRLTSLIQLYQALGGGWVAAQDTMQVNSGLSGE